MAGYDPFKAVQGGIDFSQGIFDRSANLNSGRAAARGDYTAAANAQFQNGNLVAAGQLQDRGTALDTAARARRVADGTAALGVYKQVTDALEGEVANGPEAVTAAFARIRPVLERTGATPDQLNAYQQMLQQDPIGAIRTVRGAIGQAEWEFRDGGAGDVVAVRQGPGGRVESQVAYDAPDRPIATQFGIILPPSARPAGSTVGSAPAATGGVTPAMTGPSISNSPLWSRQEQQESGGRQSAVSPVGAFGVAQLMPETAAEMARQMGVSPQELRTDENLNRQAGQRYMDQQLQKYGGNEVLALAAYNAGPGRVDEWIQRFGDPRTGEITTEEFAAQIPFNETRNYVRNITQGNYGGSQAQPQAQGSDQGQELQDLGGGYTLQPMQTEADRRAARSEERANRSEARAQAQFERSNAPVRLLSDAEKEAAGLPTGQTFQRDPQGRITPVGGSNERYTQDQRQAAGFTFRLENAANSLANLERQGVARPSAAILAFGEGRLRENALNSTDRRWLQAAREWLAPVLRRDTGAAVGPGELVTYMGIYLPSPTDDQATLEQKRQARLVAQQALRGQAGGAYDDLIGTVNSGQSSTPTTPQRGLRFQATPQQTAASQQIVAARRGGAEPARGTTGNPILINPADPRGSYGNVRAGQYYLDPTGQLRQRR